MTSSLFTHIERLQGETPWGSLLDAGTGVASAKWIVSLPTRRWTAVTAAEGHATQVREAVGDRMRADDRLLLGNWMDPALLHGEVHDTVIADYLVGAIEGFGPYFQESLFRRLRPLVGNRLYVVGLDPYVVGDAPTPAARLVREIGRLRDICLLLADETPYREYPAEWVVDQVEQAGFTVLSARRFANRYRARWINSQLDMGLRRLAGLADRALVEAVGNRIEAIRAEAIALAEAEGGLVHGFDYVIAAEPGTAASPIATVRPRD